MSSSTISIPVRVDAETAQAVKQVAQRRSVSANRLWVDVMEGFLAAEREREWREGFEAMANDPESCDVSYMTPLATEAFDRAGL